MRLRYGILYPIIVFSLAAGLAVAVDSPRPAVDSFIAPTPAVAAPALLPDISGQWTGTWTDTIYSVSGALTFDIAVNGSAYTATGTIDVGSINSTLGVLLGTALGTSTATTIDGTFNVANLGNGTVTITAAAPATFSGAQVGAATASGGGTVGAPLSFGPFTFTGTVTGQALSGTFDFTNPGGGAGKASLSKTTTPVRETSWGRVKAGYREP